MADRWPVAQPFLKASSRNNIGICFFDLACLLVGMAAPDTRRELTNVRFSTAFSSKDYK